MIPTNITLSATDYDELLAIIKWDQSMPPVLNNRLGDRYSDNLWEIKRGYIPTNLEDWEYISYVSQNGNGTGITVVFGTDDKEGDINIPVIRGDHLSYSTCSRASRILHRR
jgi:hypothetical protein